MNEYDDDSLLARLRAADPAASLPPADPERVADLLEDVMGETTTRTTESRDTGARDRSPLTWLVAAAAVLLIMATGAFALVDRGHDTTATADQTVTSLAVPQTQGRCLSRTPPSFDCRRSPSTAPSPPSPVAPPRSGSTPGSPADRRTWPRSVRHPSSWPPSSEAPT